jgi:arylsulfatase A-like enzyme
VVAFASACDLVLDGSGGSGAKGGKSGRPNVILLTLDTTRADHLGCYGYAEAGTPNIDRLAGEGIVFENAVAQAPLTLPSHASLLTGTYPFVHGVRDNGGFYLEEHFLTLAEMLKDNGYTTAAFVGAFVVD